MGNDNLELEGQLAHSLMTNPRTKEEAALSKVTQARASG